MALLKHLVVALFVFPNLTWLQTQAEERLIRLENESAQLVVNSAGGSIADFHLVNQNLNPLSWREASDAPGPHWMGHFLCLVAGQSNLHL